jgi:hypothetical protein
MIVSNHSTSAVEQVSPLTIKLLIVAQGVVTVFMSFATFPLGTPLVLANIAMVFFSQGTNRSMFLVFALVSGTVSAVIGFLLWAAGGTYST